MSEYRYGNYRDTWLRSILDQNGIVSRQEPLPGMPASPYESAVIALAGAIWRYTDPAGRGCRASQATLAANAGITRQWASVILKRLRREGVITATQEHKGGTLNISVEITSSLLFAHATFIKHPPNEVANELQDRHGRRPGTPPIDSEGVNSGDRGSQLSGQGVSTSPPREVVLEVDLEVEKQQPGFADAPPALRLIVGDLLEELKDKNEALRAASGEEP
jgi:hypothetical protein